MCSESKHGEGQSLQQEAARDQHWPGAHKGCYVPRCPSPCLPPPVGTAPCFQCCPSQVSGAAGLVGDGWGGMPAWTALVTAPWGLIHAGEVKTA